MESERRNTPFMCIGLGSALNMTKDFFDEIGRGNPGALTFITETFMGDPKLWEKAYAGFKRLKQFNIVGDKIYMLWNDCCDRNTAKAVDIMLAKSIEDIFAHLNYERGRGIPFEDGDYE